MWVIGITADNCIIIFSSDGSSFRVYSNSAFYCIYVWYTWGGYSQQMFFYSFFGLETSFLAYICIFGQIRKKCKKKFFWPKPAAILENFSENRTRARADGSITRSILLWFLRFLEWCFMTVLSQMYFFIFLINWKLTISGYILKWRDYFSLFLTFFDFQRHLKSPIYFFPKNKKIHLR